MIPNSLRTYIWSSLVDPNLRGMLVIHDPWRRFNDEPITQYTFLNRDTRTNYWRGIPIKWIKFWLHIGAIQLDEEFEVEKALGLTRWRNSVLYTVTEKGKLLYASRSSTPRKYV